MGEPKFRVFEWINLTWIHRTGPKYEHGSMEDSRGCSSSACSVVGPLLIRIGHDLEGTEGICINTMHVLAILSVVSETMWLITMVA